MEVFVLLAGWNYEGSEVLGVYASEAEAEEAFARYMRDETVVTHDFHAVRRLVVGAPALSEND